MLIFFFTFFFFSVKQKLSEVREGRTAADLKLRVCGSEKDRQKVAGGKSTIAHSNSGNGTDSEKIWG
jgi:hypothetical protein